MRPWPRKGREQSDPDVCPGLAVGQVDVQQVGLGNRFERSAKPARAVAGAEMQGRSRGDGADLVEAGNFGVRKPEPLRGVAAILTGAGSTGETALDGGSDVGEKAGGVEIRRGKEKILGEGFGVGLKSDHAAGKRGEIRLERADQAGAAERNLRAAGLTMTGGLAAEIESVRAERGHPGSVVIEMNAFGGHTRQTSPPVEGARTKGDAGIGVFVREARHAFGGGAAGCERPAKS
jgi:hypothetical protein